MDWNLEYFPVLPRKINLDLKSTIQDNDFLIDLIKLEAKDLLQDLKSHKLLVVLLEPEYKNHEGQKVRRTIERNVDWYKDLYWSSGETWKRNHTIKFLKQISKGILNYDSIYVQKLLYLILHRLNVEIEGT